MNWIKFLGYSFLFLSIYLLVSIFLSITPILLNIIGIGSSNESLLSKQQYYYFRAPMRSIIQGNAGCVQADRNLGYKQKPGDCVFTNFEFDTLLKFNEYGAIMPKSNLSNIKENIIVVGDSHAMGWGVSYDETFSYILGKNDYKITNLSMSSYGTEQEVLSAIASEQFTTADTIIIQYCDNDFGKNQKKAEEYIEREFKSYQKAARSDFTVHDKLHNAAKLYLSDFSIREFILFPARVLNSSFKTIERSDVSYTSHTHKKFIKEILDRYEIVKTKSIIIFYSNGHGVRFSDWNESDGKVKFVDLDIQRYHYNMIDDHLNKDGHRYIANSLIKILAEIE